MNSFSLVGALTKDPSSMGSGESRVCRLRLVEAGGHPDHPLYIDASVFGPQAEACHGHLRKGRRSPWSGGSASGSGSESI